MTGQRNEARARAWTISHRERRLDGDGRQSAGVRLQDDAPERLDPEMPSSRFANAASPEVFANTSMRPTARIPTTAAARMASNTVTVLALMCGQQWTWLSTAPTRSVMPGRCGPWATDANGPSALLCFIGAARPRSPASRMVCIQRDPQANAQLAGPRPFQVETGRAALYQSRICSLVQNKTPGRLESSSYMRSKSGSDEARR